jgi:hypothetical protein
MLLRPFDCTSQLQTHRQSQTTLACAELRVIAPNSLLRFQHRLPGLAGRSRGNSNIVGFRTLPRRACAAQAKARCVGAHLAGAARTPPVSLPATQTGSCPPWLARQRRRCAPTPLSHRDAASRARAEAAAPGPWCPPGPSCQPAPFPPKTPFDRSPAFMANRGPSVRGTRTPRVVGPLPARRRQPRPIR